MGFDQLEDMDGFEPIADNVELASGFYKGAELEGAPLTLTIKAIGSKTIEGDAVEALFFEENSRKVRLNATNKGRLTEMFGGKAGDWKGQKVQVGSEPAMNPSTNKIGPSVRIQKLGGTDSPF